MNNSGPLADPRYYFGLLFSKGLIGSPFTTNPNY